MTNETTLVLKVEDMTCGHCVRAITSAVETAAPGAKVSVDLAAHRVAVAGAADIAGVADAIAAAGYTPVVQDLAASGGD